MITARQIESSVDTWHTPPECQGQIVEVAYGSDCAGSYYRRTVDRSDGTTSYAVADATEDFEPWNAAPAVAFRPVAGE